MHQRFLPLPSTLNVQGGTVIVRVDFNVPIIDGKVFDSSKIEKVLPTIKYLQEQKAKIILISHLGRPHGKKNTDLSLRIVGEKMSEIIGSRVDFSDFPIDSVQLKGQIDSLSEREILLLENLRFYPEEEDNNNAFVLRIASLADFYINDAFSCSHRNHASIVGLPTVLRSAFGLSFVEEVVALEKILSSDCHPMAAIIGGVKISTKIELIQKLTSKFDFLLVGGAMANTFLAAQGKNVGVSMYDYDSLDEVNKLLQIIKNNNCELILPSDAVVVKSFADNASAIKSVDKIADDEMIVDIGPKTIRDFMNRLLQCKTVLWNGPLGAYEHKSFDVGTIMIARFLAHLTKDENVKTVVGGGDSIAALNNMKISASSFTYLSTSGGAFINWLITRNDLPGLKAIVGSVK